MRSTGIALTFLSACFSAFAQIQPPELNCIEGSGTQIEIAWNQPGVQCGPLQGYQIFFSEQPGGPYTTLDVSNPALTDTVFATTAQIIYCFMQSVMDCPGEQPVNSDTLIWDLNPPVMKTVSVNDAGQVEVTWFPSASPDIEAYLVYVDGGNIPDTVFGNQNTTWIDPVSDPSASSHDYKLAWWRDCVDDGDRRGSIGLPYNTIFAQNLQQDRCSRTFSFSWSRYENYDDGILGYEIEARSGSDPFTPVDTVPASQQIYSYQVAVPDLYYCFRVNALLPDGCKAASNQLCDTARIVQIPLGGQVRNATVINDNNVEVEFYPDSVGDIQRFYAERSTFGDNYGEWPVSDEGTAGNPVYNIYKDAAADAAATDYHYRFVREDDCDVRHVSDTVKTIWLDAGLTSGLSAELEWTAYANSNAVVTGYTIVKVLNGLSSDLVTVGPNTLSYVEENALNPTSLDTVCYRIVAEADLDIRFVPGTVNDVVFSESNIVCLQPRPRVIFPRAFRPEGFNTHFGPIISFGTADSYNFRIYDRYNRKLFETENVNEFWDGRDGGEIAPMGNYVYYLIFRGQDGVLYKSAGNVLLIR